jgi:hypothetical protein
MHSEEYRGRADTLAVSHVNSLLASQGTQLVNGRPVAHLASLGSFCLPSLLFQKNGLKSYSLPFDWIFSTPRMVRDCLADDFAELLDRSHYRSVDPPRQEPAAEHLIYRERYGVPMLFAHRDPTRDADYLYFVRCVTRFRRLLQSDDPKLFWVIGRPNHDLVNEFPRLIESLKRVTKNFVLLCIELLDAAEPGVTSIVPVARTDVHELHRFTPSAFQINGGLLPDKLDEWTLLRLVYRYKLDLKESPWGEGSSEAAESDCEETDYHREPQHALP